MLQHRRQRGLNERHSRLSIVDGNSQASWLAANVKMHSARSIEIEKYELATLIKIKPASGVVRQKSRQAGSAYCVEK